MDSTVYLDYAATSAIRPDSVADAMHRYMVDVGATPGRSGHSRAIQAGRLALRCRRLLAELLGIEGDPGRIVFQLNATHALNTALFGVLAPGDRVVRTRYDHNAVRRPLAALAVRGVEESVIEIDADGVIDLSQAERLLQGPRPARMLVLPHASNVTGVVLPVRELAGMAHDAGALVLVDLAQTAGHFPVDVVEMGVDLAAFTGHKGLLGPQGVGGLWVREGVEVAPLIHGGTSGDSFPAEMPPAYPDHLEAGTQNAPGIAGLAAGLDRILNTGVATIASRERLLRERLVQGLESIAGVRICSPRNPNGVGIVTILHDDVTAAQLARAVEATHGVQGRAGLHCAPDAHMTMGTLESGAFRLSIGWATTEADVDTAIAAVNEVRAGVSQI